MDRIRRGRRGWPLAPIVLALLAAALGAACSREPSAGRSLTERERDSTLGRSSVPGAGAVSRALGQSDRAAGEARALDAQVDSLTR